MNEQPRQHHCYEFGGYLLDATRRVIHAKGDGTTVRMAPKLFDAALYFVQHPGELLLKEQLLADLWSGLIVEENSLTQLVSGLRRTLGEGRRENRYIATVPRRGYRFVALVKSVETGEPAQPLHDRTVAVLPFDNLGHAAGDELLAIGLAESILHRLAATSGLKLVSQTSSFAFRGMRIDAREIGRQLGARYIVEGSLQHAGRHRRITAQLIDARDGTHVWSKMFDRSTGDVFDVEDYVASQVAAELGRSLCTRAPAHQA